MWIYVICKTCGRNLARAVALSEIAPSLPIVMEDGAIAAEIFQTQCRDCWSHAEHQDIGAATVFGPLVAIPLSA